MPRPVPEVVAVLEEMLAEARRGGIVAVAVTALDPDGEWDEDWYGRDMAMLACAVRSTLIRMQLPGESKD